MIRKFLAFASVIVLMCSLGGSCIINDKDDDENVSELNVILYNPF